MNRRPAEADLPAVIGVTSHRIDSGSGRRADDGQHRDYCASLVLAGAAPVLIPLGLGEAALRAIYARLDGLLLPGGPDVAPEHYGHKRHAALGGVDPELDRTELALARWALEDGLPILGICRG
jgi:putative glutamine amidotransferase